jgi:hypothetical protein
MIQILGTALVPVSRSASIFSRVFRPSISQITLGWKIVARVWYGGEWKVLRDLGGY